MSKITALIPLRQKIIDHIMEYGKQLKPEIFVPPSLTFCYGVTQFTDDELLVLRENIFRIKDHRGRIFPRHTIRARMHELRNDTWSPEHPKPTGATPKIISVILKQMVMIGK